MNNYSSVRVGVAGATGYAGLELLRRLAPAPARGRPISPWRRAPRNRSGPPALARIWDAPVEPLDVDELAAETDAVFLALPDTLAAELAPGARRRAARGSSICQVRSGCVTRRSPAAGIRIRPRRSPAGRLWPDRAPPRRAARSARLVACPGCYPTAAVLALQPLVAAALLEPGIIIDAKSGISGAGKTPTERTHFSECHGSIAAYGVFAHRHAAEIEQELGTCRHVCAAPRAARPRHLRDDLRAAAARHRRERRSSGAHDRAYADSPFVRLTGRGFAGDQARRAHELLRHRLAGSRQSARDGRRASTTW